MSLDGTYLKGHGTGNDFVLWPDPDGTRPVSAELAIALCHRRFGVGADGVLRVVPTRHLPAVGGQDAAWFMDHRNADGTVAAMCGNGIRLFGRYLVDAGLAAAGAMTVGTWSGAYDLDVPVDGEPTVHMGQVSIGGPSSVQIAGKTYDGTVVEAGTRHLVCPVADELDSFDLSVQPLLDPAVFPDGANIELVRTRAVRHVAMRVHERGAGETMSCGTGATAVATLVAQLSGVDSGEIRIDVPGGQLHVGADPTDVTLRGPAQVVSRGILSQAWLAAAGRSAERDEGW